LTPRDEARGRSPSKDVHAALPDDAPAPRVVAPASVDSSQSPETLARFAELRAPLPEALDKEQAKAIVRELKAVGGNLQALRIALSGRERGPELWAVLCALPRDEALRRALP